MMKKIVQSLLLSVWVLVAPLAQAAVVNINKADAAVMVENFDGIGPKKAAAIVAYRKAQGPFKSLDELLNVKGIGEKTIARNRQDMSLNKGLTKVETKAKSSAKKPLEDANKTSSAGAVVKKAS